MDDKLRNEAQELGNAILAHTHEAQETDHENLKLDSELLEQVTGGVRKHLPYVLVCCACRRIVGEYPSFAAAYKDSDLFEKYGCHFCRKKKGVLIDRYHRSYEK